MMERIFQRYIVIIIFIVCLENIFVRMISFQNTKAFGGDDFECVMTMRDRVSLGDMFSVEKITLGTGYNTYYMPLSLFIFSVIFKTSHGNTVGFIYFNHFFHVINGFLLFALIHRLVRQKIIAAISASFFLLYKPNIETLFWLSAGMERSFCMFLVLTSLLSFDYFLRKNNYFLYGLSILLAIMSYLMKPIAYFLPFTLIFYYCHLKIGLNEWRIDKIKRLILICGPYFACLLPFFLISMSKYPYGNVAKSWGGASLGIHTILRALDLGSRILMMNEIFVPIRAALMILLLLVTFFLIAYSLYKNNAIILFGLTWLWLGILLTSGSNFRPTFDVLRYLYLPIGGGIVIVAVLSHKIIQYTQNRIGTIYEKKYKSV